MSSVASTVAGFVGLSVVATIIFDLLGAEPAKSIWSIAFRLRCAWNWLPMGLVYCGFYTARYNMTAANVPWFTSTSAESGMLKGSIPLALTVGFWSYAAKAPWTGLYADKVGGRCALLLAVTGSLLCNLLAYGAAAFREHVTHNSSSSKNNNMTLLTTGLVVILFAVNVVASGFGTSAVVKINAAWYGPQERGTFRGIFNVLISSGYYTALGAGSWIASQFGFASLFLLPEVILGVGGIFVLVWTQNQPEFPWHNETQVSIHIPKPLISPTLTSTGDVGKANTTTNKMDNYSLLLSERTLLLQSKFPQTLENVETDDYDYGDTAISTAADMMMPNDDVNKNGTSSLGKLTTDMVFLCYCLALFFLSFVRDGLISWIVSFLEVRSGSSLTVDATSMVGAGITIGGFVGGVGCGILSDVVFGGKRIPPMAVFVVGQIVALLFLHVAGGRFGGDNDYHVMDTLILLITCFFVCGNYSLINYSVPCDLDPDVIGTAVGMLTTSGYIASGMAGVVMKKIIELGGYRAWTLSMLAASFLTGPTVLFGKVISMRRHQHTNL